MTPLPIVYPIAGGLMIGLAAALFLILSGRIAGVSGMLAAGLRIADRGPGASLALLFVLALPAGAWLASAFVRAPDIEVTASPALLIAGGLLVGFGTRLGNGCTSGHGVCGLARLSARSMVATASFMAAGFLTVFLVRHVFA